MLIASWIAPRRRVCDCPVAPHGKLCAWPELKTTPNASLSAPLHQRGAMQTRGVVGRTKRSRPEGKQSGHADHAAPWRVARSSSGERTRRACTASDGRPLGRRPGHGKVPQPAGRRGGSIMMYNVPDTRDARRSAMLGGLQSYVEEALGVLLLPIMLSPLLLLLLCTTSAKTARREECKHNKGVVPSLQKRLGM